MNAYADAFSKTVILKPSLGQVVFRNCDYGTSRHPVVVGVNGDISFSLSTEGRLLRPSLEELEKGREFGTANSRQLLHKVDW